MNVRSTDRTRLSAVITVAVAAAIGLSACGGSSGSSGGGGNSGSPATKGALEGGGTATLAISADWPTLDVQKNTINSNVPMAMAAYDRLIARSPDDKIVPYVAKSWEVTPEDSPTKVVFHLRDDVKCNDGHILTPSDVAASFQRWVTVKKTGVNAMPTYFGPGPYTISADDKAGTFTFETKTPFRQLLPSFASGGSVIYCPEAIKNPAALEQKSYGSGPFNIVSAAHGDQVVLTRNNNWTWGPMGTTYKTLPDKLIYKVVADPSTIANLLLTGGIDITASGITGPSVARLLSNKSLIYKKGLNYHSTPLAFNQYPGRITNDESVRAAIIAAVDPEAFNKAAYAGQGVVTNGSLVMDKQECYSPSIKLPPPSVERGKQLLTQGGWTQSGGKWVKNGKPLKLYILGDERVGAGNEYLLNAIRSLGIDATMKVKDAASYGADSISGNFDVEQIGYTVVAPEPGQDLAIISGKTPPDGINVADTGRGNADYQAQAADALRYAGEKGCEAFNKFNQTMLDNNYVFPMAMPPYNMFSAGKWDFAPIAQWFEVAYLKRLKQ